MAHRFSFTVEVSCERESGLFASRDEMQDAIRDMLENANEGSISGIGANGDSEYTIEDWEVIDA